MVCRSGAEELANADRKSSSRVSTGTILQVHVNIICPQLDGSRHRPPQLTFVRGDVSFLDVQLAGVGRQQARQEPSQHTLLHLQMAERETADKTQNRHG
jgi:hypothetical protein